MSDSVRPHRWQPTRLPRPWDSPGKNIGVGCHVLLQCMKVKSETEVTQSCLTCSDLVGCSPPGSSVHGIFQAKLLEGVAIAFLTPLKSYLPGDPLQVRLAIFIQESNSQFQWLPWLNFTKAPINTRWKVHNVDITFLISYVLP